ncbi:radical SAM/SPASM domain-containing protein [Streptomyces sp. NPDC058284]|uniref:radical SAM/SPASM domain-containing protein n=1 Tax=unclassified Streptomyces TaxID=2593676 RepID=UPI00365B4EB7
MTASVVETPRSTPPQAIKFLWLDLTRKCQLACTHCYNSSGPDGTHGAMTRDDWLNALNQAHELGLRSVTLIGGEPTLHPHAVEVAEHALNLGIEVEVYSNLVHVPNVWWDLLQREGMSLATSYYSDKAEEHNRVTRRPSHARTRANIAKAMKAGVPIRVGIVGDDEQRIEAAKLDLKAMGVSKIGVDRIREFGRASEGQEPEAANLCGGCGDGRASIDPTGKVSPCVFSTWMGVGDVRDDALASILGGPALSEAVASIHGAIDGQAKACRPDCVPNNPCDPRCEPNSSGCRPGTPPSECKPKN